MTDEVALFRLWVKNHGPSKETLWALQNMLGSVLGFDHPLSLETKKAWVECREKENEDSCQHLAMTSLQMEFDQECPRCGKRPFFDDAPAPRNAAWRSVQEERMEAFAQMISPK